MLAHRVIPSLLHRGTTLVKGQRFDSWRSVGHVLQAARIHAARGVDELLVLDIAATPEGRGPDLDLVRQITGAGFTPVTVGGGVRTVEDVRGLLNAGADKVAIGAAAFLQDDFITRCAETFGCQAIVAALNVHKDSIVVGGLQGRTVFVGAVSAAKNMEIEGAGEILLTSIDREGTMTGYDLPLIKAVSEAVSIPVIAHGGAGTYQHMLEAIQAGASAVAAGAMFQFTDQTPRGASEYLQANGVEARV